ncbi:BQ5605_C021g09373 [Microbotryum silenes-dioicae]|uniref:BQ5605_C021g09373 protein n=1 Tax=Microbotryum silenes-dioicae TaxID=796604 RepID=A0A2X0MKG4_9BASI|nr:BQ5605_C021g09373 [Microbotryum silenes-dioicae]
MEEAVARRSSNGIVNGRGGGFEQKRTGQLSASNKDEFNGPSSGANKSGEKGGSSIARAQLRPKLRRARRLFWQAGRPVVGPSPERSGRGQGPLTFSYPRETGCGVAWTK